jgi:hypothetical protein
VQIQNDSWLPKLVSSSSQRQCVTQQVICVVISKSGCCLLLFVKGSDDSILQLELLGNRLCPLSSISNRTQIFVQ